VKTEDKVLSTQEHAGVATSPQEPTVFFTGKPYVDGLGYVFKYRNYNPELCRWQSADPSGFPDGANNQIYAPCPTSGLDPTGLEIDTAYSPLVPINSIKLDIKQAVYTLLTLNTQKSAQTLLQGLLQSSWEISAKGVATYDTNKGEWSNIQSFTIEGGNITRSGSIGGSATVAGVGVAGTYSLSITLSYNGSPNTVSQTAYSPGHPASITLSQDLYATVTESFTIAGNPGPGTTYTDSYAFDQADPVLTIYE